MDSQLISLDVMCTLGISTPKNSSVSMTSLMVDGKYIDFLSASLRVPVGDNCYHQYFHITSIPSSLSIVVRLSICRAFRQPSSTIHSMVGLCPPACSACMENCVSNCGNNPSSHSLEYQYHKMKYLQ